MSASDFEVDGIYYNIIDDYNVCVTAGGVYEGEITIPAVIEYENTEYGVSQIESGAFVDCNSLITLSIPSSIVNIEGNAIGGCNSLISIFVDPANLYYSSIDGLLYNKDVTRLICCPGGKIEVEIPDSVTVIEGTAFLGNYNLTSVILPESLIKIGAQAFQYCSGLTSINIPVSVEEIETYAFAGCWNMTSINVASENPFYTSIEGILYNKDQTTLICCPGGKTEVIIPETVTDIAIVAFSNCTSLTSCFIPNSVTTIGPEAFSHCRALKSIEIPESVMTIEDAAFYECNSLSDIRILGPISAIGDKLFYYCNSLTSVDIPETVMSIGNQAFAFCGLDDISLPMSLMEIGENAFIHCNSLETIDIPATVKNIGDGAFYSCSLLTSINVNPDNENYSSIDGVLYNKEVTILICCPNGKQNIEIPETITTIQVNAFQYSKSLESVTCYSSIPPIIESDNFNYKYPNSPLYVYENALNDYLNSDWSLYFSNILSIESMSVETLSTKDLISVYSLSGTLVIDKCIAKDLKSLAKGIYIIVSGKERYKIAI